ncbi:sensor histidine kinase [uncultured Aquimarina sp.]|uniref:sensor histidine kinase n=1 Tax=uncultured Aquimarina sp. TaxID=575652 RepID=UPI002627B749|nr:sensor histidine kinase [uncultured Aquimarina sp.]
MHKRILTLFLFSSSICFSQDSNDYFDAIRTFNIDSISIDFFTESKPKVFFLKQQYLYLKYGEILDPSSKNFDITAFSKKQKTFYHLAQGDYYIRSISDEKSDSIAFSNYFNALRIAEELNDKVIVCEALKRILVYQFKNQKDIPAFSRYAKKYKKLAYDKHERLYANYFYMGSILGKIYHLKDYSEDPLPVGKKNLEISKKNNNFFFQGRFAQLLGVHYDLILKKPEIGREFYNEAINSYRKIEYDYGKKHIHDILYNLGTVEQKNGNFKKALFYLNQIDETSIENRDYKDLIFINDYKYKTYKNQNQLDSALYFLEKKYHLNDTLKLIDRANLVSDITTKYQTTEKEKKIVQLLNTNLKTEAKRIKNRNLLIGSLVLLLFGAVTAFLTYKNTKRKQRIAEQEREIEIQKTEKLLKEQELTAIDAMISGQEKERQRLANDLHDNLGSTLATVKLHFDHLKNNRNNPKVGNIEELYSKTNNLLDEAYEKVRTIAHEKNSGVMAKQGLLPAIKNLTKKASNGNALQIEVQDYGLNERLDNTLEISIFRMIQELITNIIKHANASEINISLTNHDSLLNIIVEDNGKGFDAKILPEKDGMGLKSIEKRIEYLEGTFEIDSTLGKGTNIIINIPI